MARTTIDRQWELEQILDDYLRRIEALEQEVTSLLARLAP